MFEDATKFMVTVGSSFFLMLCCMGTHVLTSTLVERIPNSNSLSIHYSVLPSIVGEFGMAKRGRSKTVQLAVGHTSSIHTLWSYLHKR